MDEHTTKELLKPSAYPEPTTSVRLIQTHISYIFITDSYVYKVKKAVDFGFLNFTTLDRRRFYCEEEVRLNRRLCQDIYLGVVELKETAGGHAFFGAGKTTDYAVKMKRLPEERMLNRLLDEDGVTEGDIREIARVVARFHMEAERGKRIDEYGRVEAIKLNWDENFKQAASFAGVTIAERDLRLISSWGAAYLEKKRELFEERVAGGFIRDCDGDIHSGNICLDKGVCIFDCIEFNSRFRYSDTAADTAFFLMDLDYHKKGFLAAPFLDEYISVTGDMGMSELLPFYKTYRAFVRGKVESFSFSTPGMGHGDKEEAAAKARRYFRLARGYAIREKLPPTLIIACGLTGSGKSAIASELAFELGLEIVSSDLERKRLAGISPTEHRMDGYGEGIYAPDISAATYGALLEKAEKALKNRQSVIVDATFRKSSDRLPFREAAARMSAGFLMVRTTCPDSLAKKRLKARIADPKEVSDGRWEVYIRQKGEFETPAPDEGGEIVVDTGAGMGDNVQRILERLGIL